MSERGIYIHAKTRKVSKSWLTRQICLSWNWTKSRNYRYETLEIKEQHLRWNIACISFRNTDYAFVSVGARWKQMDTNIYTVLHTFTQKYRRRRVKRSDRIFTLNVLFILSVNFSTYISKHLGLEELKRFFSSKIKNE